MSQHANDLLVRQIQETITAITRADADGSAVPATVDRRVLLLRAAPLSLLKLHRRDLADGLTLLPIDVLTTAPRMLGADAVDEERKEFWHSLAEQLFAEQSVGLGDEDDEVR